MDEQTLGEEPVESRRGAKAFSSLSSVHLGLRRNGGLLATHYYSEMGWAWRRCMYTEGTSSHRA
jgi:hypothetical protein